MAVLGVNPDLPRSWRRPGTYVYINLNAPGGGGDISKRLIVFGEKLAAGTNPPDMIYRVNSQQEVDDGSGRGSTAARNYAAAMSQVGGGVLETWVAHVDEPSAGTAATHFVQLFGAATKAGAIRLSICGYEASVAFVTGDTAATLGPLLKAQIDLLLDAPVTAGVSTDLITLTYRHKGVLGEDLPIRCYVTPSSGIRVGPGTLSFATSVTGAGSVTVTDGARVVTAAIANSDTAAAAAAKVVAAINAGNNALQAEISTADVKLYYVNDRDHRRVSAAIVTSTGITVTFNGGTPGASAVNGVAGAGAPTLTNLLTVIKAQNGFGRWACPWTDATTIGIIDTAIESEADGLRQKNQTVHVANCSSLAVAGAIPGASSPKLSATIRWAEGWLKEGPQQGYEYAARLAAARGANDYPGKNWDGFALKTSGSVPLLAPASDDRADSSDINSAIQVYYLTPLRYDEVTGKTVIEFARTTLASTDSTVHDWSCIDQLDYQRQQIVERMQLRFGGLSAKKVGAPATLNTIDKSSVEEELYLLTREWEAMDLFDGAEELKDSIKAQWDPSLAGRINLVYTASVVVPIHQISVVANRGSAAV